MMRAKFIRAPFRRRSGLALLRAGRYREAERVQQSDIAGLDGPLELAYAYETLGDALLEQGRYSEAMRNYEAALDAHPRFRRAYRGMAEVLLRQGGDPGQALERVERISENPPDDYWSLKAWALAELGRNEEAAPAVDNALRSTNPSSRTDLAATWRRVGLAMREMGRPGEAAVFLKHAAEIDPHGRWGMLAKAALVTSRDREGAVPSSTAIPSESAP
jgi:tetratricopeptide (TPR) repeat protein